MKGGKRAGAGRKVGSLSKKGQRIEVAERLAAMGCDPFDGMAKIAADETAPLELRGRMYAELAQYISPKLRSIEKTTEITHRYVALVPEKRLTVEAWQQQRSDPTKNQTLQ